MIVVDAGANCLVCHTALFNLPLSVRRTESTNVLKTKWLSISQFE